MFSECVQKLSKKGSDELKKIIADRKQALGDSLVILAHHYQQIDVVRFGDFIGDSFKLAEAAAQQKKVKNVLFCGVSFMAEAADILTPASVKVQLAAPTADCPMAAMAQLEEVEEAVEAIRQATGKEVLPVVYMNSYADIKALAGKLGGTVCTSSNAPKALAWALSQNRPVLFLPDRNLGLNSAKKLGLNMAKVVVWQRRKPMGGLSKTKLAGADLVVWGGFCHVHVMFKPEHIEAARRTHKDAKIVVHPECDPQVVEAADADGSTAFIVKYVNELPEGSTVYIGTEVHLVERLALEHPNKTIIPLWKGSICFNMAKTTLAHVACALSEEYLGKSGLVKVDSETAHFAKIALEKMLELK